MAVMTGTTMKRATMTTTKMRTAKRNGGLAISAEIKMKHPSKKESGNAPLRNTRRRSGRRKSQSTRRNGVSSRPNQTRALRNDISKKTL